MKTLFTLLLLFLLAPAAPGWDSGGHQLVAEIAWRQLPPANRREIAPLLPLLDHRFHAGHPYHFVTAAAWLDDIKAAPLEYPWSRRHYLNLPCGEPPRKPAEGENAWSALQTASATLKDRRAPARERAHALAHVIHIIGDIHQPLHVSTRDDRGGNGYLLVPIRPSPPGATSFRPFNLHAFWDGAYRYGVRDGHPVELWVPPAVTDRPEAPGADGPIATHATRLLAEYPPPEPLRAGDPWAWIVEAHTLGCRHGWPEGPPPASHEVARLKPAFVETSRPLAERQIVRAGYRLAAWLNRLLGNPASEDGSSPSILQETP